MADYCKECSEILFGNDFRELADLSKPEDTAKGVCVQVLCEGCGPTLVDHDGLCQHTCEDPLKIHIKPNHVKRRQALPNLVSDINDFHTKFGFTAPEKPSFITDEQLRIRLNFQLEELQETAHAAGFYLQVDSDGKFRYYRNQAMVQDLVKFFDGLIDQVYVAIGTSWLCNLPFGEGWKRVQAANMAKKRAERAEESTRGTTFDVVKPAGWTPPTLDDLLD